MYQVGANVIAGFPLPLMATTTKKSHNYFCTSLISPGSSSERQRTVAKAMGPPPVEHVTISLFCSISLSGWHGTKLYLFFLFLNNFLKAVHTQQIVTLLFTASSGIPEHTQYLPFFPGSPHFYSGPIKYFFLELTNFPYPGQRAVLFNQSHSHAIFHKENRDKGEGTGFGIQMI